MMEASQQMVSFSGPIPPPEIIKAYDDTIEGAGRDIIDMAKAEGEHRREQQRLEAEHRREMDRQQMDLVRQEFTAESTRKNRAQVIALVVELSALGCGTLLMLGGAPVMGIISLLTGVGGLVASTAYPYLKRDESADSPSEPDPVADDPVDDEPASDEPDRKSLPPGKE